MFKVYTECLFFWTVELDPSSATDWEHYEMFKNGVNSGDLVAQFPIPVSVGCGSDKCWLSS